MWGKMASVLRPKKIEIGLNPPPLSRRGPREMKPKTDYQALVNSPSLQQELTHELDENLKYSNITDINDLNSHIISVVNDSVKKVCPQVTEQNKKEPWENDELKQMIRDLNTCTDFRRTREIQKNIKKKRKTLKDEYYGKIASEMNTLAEAREVEKEFSMAKKYGMLKSGSKTTISNQKLQEHFEQHFSARELPMPPELEKPEEYPHLCDEIIPVNEEVPDDEETSKTLKNFKNKKSSGTDKTKTESLKYNQSKTLVNAIVYLLTMIWALVAVPGSWLHCSITCLYKKGPMSIASNYRGLSIGANMSRILAKIIMNRLQEGYEKHISEEQYGFRKNRSTADGIFLIKNIIEKYGGPLVVVYIDLTAAYDHVPRNFLFRLLRIRTGANHLISILQKMYEGTTASIKGCKAKFDVLIGCRQGGQESPCLFNYYFDYVLKVAASEIDKIYPEGWGIKLEFNIPHWCTNREQRRRGRMNGVEIIRWILYADDVALFCKSSEEAESLLNIINDTCKRFGLTVSFKKTKTQVFNCPELVDKLSLFKIEDETIENVKKFTYLGQDISNDKNECFTQYRRARATSKFNELRGVLTDKAINMKTRRKLLESCVRSRLLYGTQAWYPNEAQMKKLKSCWMTFLRSMVKGGFKRRNVPDGNDGLGEGEEADYSYIYNNARIEKIVGSPPLETFVNSQYLKYVGHTCRRENTRLTKKMLFAIPTKPYFRDPWLKISNLMGISIEQAKRTTQSRKKFAELVRKCANPPS